MTKSKTLSKLIAYVVAIVMLVSNISPAYATSHFYISDVASDSNHYTYGYANTTALYTKYNASSSSYDHTYTDWVQDPWDDTVTMTGGTLITNGLYSGLNGSLYASGGNLTVQSGYLTIGSGSYINSGVNLSLGSGAILRQTGGSITINSGDSINSGSIRSEEAHV